MTTDRGSILTAVTVLAGAAAAYFGFAWPNYRAASSLQAEIAHLQQRISTSDEQHVSLDALATRLADAHSKFDESLREIPEAPDVAGLMRALTMDADKEAGPVFEQTVTFGRPANDPVVDDGSISIQPLTVDMRARFDPIFDLVRTAERLARLVRVASVLIERSKESEEQLVATVRLEAVYETGEREETE